MWRSFVGWTVWRLGEAGLAWRKDAVNGELEHIHTVMIDMMIRFRWLALLGSVVGVGEQYDMLNVVVLAWRDFVCVIFGDWWCMYSSMVIVES